MSLVNLESELQKISHDSEMMGAYDRWKTLDGHSKKWKRFGGMSDDEAAILHAQLRAADRIRNIYDDRCARKAGELAENSGIIKEYTGDLLAGAHVVAKTEEGSPEWHRARRFGLGGSSISGALGLHWKSRPGSPVFMEQEEIDSKWTSMAVEKSADLTPSEINDANPKTGAAYRGHLWEPALLVHYAVTTGKHVAVTKNTWCSDVTFQRVNLDGLILNPSTGEVEGILECKTALRRWLWQDGVPVNYRAQVAWYLNAFQLPYADVIVRYEDGDMDIFRINAEDSIADSSDTLPIGSYINGLNERWNLLQERVAEPKSLWDIDGKLIEDKNNLDYLGVEVGSDISSELVKKILSGNIVNIIEDTPFPRMPERFLNIIGAETLNNKIKNSYKASNIDPMIYPMNKVSGFNVFETTDDIIQRVMSSSVIYVVNSDSENTVKSLLQDGDSIDVVNISALKRSAELRPNAPDFKDVSEAENWLKSQIK